MRNLNQQGQNPRHVAVTTVNGHDESRCLHRKGIPIDLGWQRFSPLANGVWKTILSGPGNFSGGVYLSLLVVNF